MNLMHGSGAILAAVLFLAAPGCWGTEMPTELTRPEGNPAAVLQSSGLTPEEARARASAMDRVEQAELIAAGPQRPAGELTKEHKQILFLLVSVLAIVLVATI